MVDIINGLPHWRPRVVAYTSLQLMAFPENLSINLFVCTNIMETLHPRMTYSVTHLRGFRNELLVSLLRVRSIHVGVRILNTFCFYYVRCRLSFTCLKYFVSIVTFVSTRELILNLFDLARACWMQRATTISMPNPFSQL